MITRHVGNRGWQSGMGLVVMMTGDEGQHAGLNATEGKGPSAYQQLRMTSFVGHSRMPVKVKVKVDARASPSACLRRPAFGSARHSLQGAPLKPPRQNACLVSQRQATP